MHLHRKASWQITIIVLMALFLAACGESAKPEPSIYRIPQWQWHTDTSSPTLEIPIPLTDQNPGPTVRVKVKHEIGLGELLTGTDLKSVAQLKGQQALSLETPQMEKLGWQSLFSPTESGAYPDYVMYTSFRAGKYYCLLEYGVVFLNETTASQQIDIYYSQA